MDSAPQASVPRFRHQNSEASTAGSEGEGAFRSCGIWPHDARILGRRKCVLVPMPGRIGQLFGSRHVRFPSEAG